jgi:hypothetical protein
MYFCLHFHNTLSFTRTKNKHHIIHTSHNTHTYTHTHTHTHTHTRTHTHTHTHTHRALSLEEELSRLSTLSPLYISPPQQHLAHQQRQLYLYMCVCVFVCVCVCVCVLWPVQDLPPVRSSMISILMYTYILKHIYVYLNIGHHTYCSLECRGGTKGDRSQIVVNHPSLV